MKINMRFFVLIFVLSQISANLFAQQDLKNANFHFKTENYDMSLKLFQKLILKDTANKELNYKLGISYLNCNSNPAAALKHLTKSSADKQQDPVYLFDMGRAYLYNYDYINAKSFFKNCSAKSGKDVGLKLEANLWFQMVVNAEQMVKSPLDVSFINLGKSINSALDENTPFVTTDNEIMLYTSNVKFDREIKIYIYNVYASNKSAGIFKKGKALAAVNTIDDEFMAGVSLSGDKIFVQQQGYDGFQDLIYSDRKGKSFRGKKQLDKNVNTKFAEFGACETINGDTLFFSSGREGGSGGLDLYFSLKLPTGEWGIAQNLGDKINTEYDEDFPVISSDGSKLYFTSNNTKSMGGFDVFESDINSVRGFSAPKNIGYPLNDVYDNKTIAFSDNDRYAYVSAIKPGGYGYADLYRVVFNQKDPAVKIFILNFKIADGEKQIPFASTDTTLSITAYKKGKVVFGEYAYIPKSSTATIALPPGDYSIEIVGKIEKVTYKISVPDTPSGNKIEKKTIVLKDKK